MLKLPDITLVAVSGLGYQTAENIKALEKSQEGIEFGAVKYLQFGGIKNIDDWNYHIIYELPDHIHTDFALLVHGDGYVINPELWRDEWLEWDYIGAPWPLPQDDYSYRDDLGRLQRVGNSVSLRSIGLMNAVATREWKPYYGNTNEDGFICCHNRSFLESLGYRIAPLEVAVHFSKEREIPENVGLKTFAFHE
uniref:DUF5672 domain-containing protein n=1 Tax=viral metagenome TaxID=1070528 RepID=A0A6M3J883_9ZZZZ